MSEQSNIPVAHEATRPTTSEHRMSFVPLTDIFESNEDVVVVAEMPGIREQDVDITLERNVLTLRGRLPQSELPEGELVLSEYELGDYERSFVLSEEVDRDKIEASMKQGVLRLRLPKAMSSRVRRIPVNAE